MALSRWLLLVGFTPALQAQSAPPAVEVPAIIGRFVPSQARNSSLVASSDLKTGALEVGSTVPKDHRWEGGAMGAFVFGALGYRYARATCNGDSGTGSCLGYHIGRTVIATAIGGIMGLFIGSSIPKERPDSVAP
jgi:hypothetical protein